MFKTVNLYTCLRLKFLLDFLEEVSPFCVRVSLRVLFSDVDILTGKVLIGKKILYIFQKFTHF